jgi:membrane-associated phospholipid phosphatase
MINRALLGITVILAMGLLIFDAVWLFRSSPFALNPDDLRTIAKTVLILALVFIVARAVNWRLSADTSKIGEWLKYIGESSQLLALMGGFMILVSTGMAAANYLLMTTALPLQDDFFAAIDQSIGFDWLAVVRWVDARPSVSWILVSAYSTSLIQMLAVVFVYSALCRGDRLLEFAALYTLTGVAVGVVAMLVPAMGAYAYYNPDPDLYDQFTDLGRVHITTLEQLRAGTFEMLEFENTVGMVTFPSFHTVLAIIVTYAFRDNVLLFAPLFILNCIVVVSTIPEGGHYLIDIFGGAVIAWLAIVFVRSFGRVEAPAKQSAAYSLTSSP